MIKNMFKSFILAVLTSLTVFTCIFTPVPSNPSGITHYEYLRIVILPVCLIVVTIALWFVIFIPEKNTSEKIKEKKYVNYVIEYRENGLVKSQYCVIEAKNEEQATKRFFMVKDRNKCLPIKINVLQLQTDSNEEGK